MLDADPMRLAQAFATLLKNAAKHTPAQGTISLSAAVEGGEVVVAVEDSGVGFEAASGAAPVRARAPASACAWCTASSRCTAGASRRAAPGRGAARNSSCACRSPRATGASAAERPRRAPRRRGPVRVLVADDNRDAADSLQRVLALYGHDVRVAYDGASALRIGQEFRPRVAVLDIAMPGSERLRSGARASAGSRAGTSRWSRSPAGDRKPTGGARWRRASTTTSSSRSIRTR